MMRLRALGQCVIEIGDVRLTPVAETLFATALYLVIEGRRPVGRGELLQLVWANGDDRRSQHCLRQVLYKLRTLGGTFRCERSHVLVPARSVATDYASLIGASDPDRLEELADGVGGTFLPGYAPRFSPPLAEWVDRQRDLVNAALRRVLVAGVAAKKQRGDWLAAEQLAKRCLAIDPLNEEATLAVAEAAAVHGSKAHAIAIIDRYLHEIGPDAREIRLPAAMLRRRIGEAQARDLIPVREAPFVGREEEMAELNRAFAAARSGHGSAYLVWGEPGIGKTRLVSEFTRAARLERAQITRVGCQSHDERRPLSAFVDLVPQLLSLPGALGCSPESLQYLRRLTEHHPGEQTGTLEAGESEALFRRIRLALFDLMDAIANEECLVLVLEDVHWLDRLSWELLGETMQWIGERALLFVFTARSSAREATRHKPFSIARQLSLRPLRPTDVDRIFDCLAQSASADTGRDFRDWCTRGSGGNPYYLVELIRHSRRLATGFAPPPTLAELIRLRLGRLTPLAQRVLQACSIIGKSSSLHRIERVLDESRTGLLDALDELELEGLVTTESGTLSCTHDLLAESVTSQTQSSSRALIHRHFAALLESEIDTSKSTALLWECAEHWLKAGDDTRAADLLCSCAQHAILIGLPRDAAEILERTVRLLPDSSAKLPVLADYIRALQSAGDWAAVIDAIDAYTATRATVSGGSQKHDELEIGRLEAWLHTSGDLRDIADAARQCVEDRSAMSTHRLQVATFCLTLADNLSDPQMANEIRRLVAGTLDDTDVNDAVKWNYHLVYECAFGDVQTGAECARKLLAIPPGDQLPSDCVRHARHAVVALRLAGLDHEAIRAAELGFRLAEGNHMPAAAAAAAVQLGFLHLRSEVREQARDWQRRAAQLVTGVRDAVVVMNYLSLSAELAIYDGELREAANLVARLRTLDIAPTPRSRGRTLALEMHARLAAGHKPRQDDLHRLSAIFQELRGGPNLDYFVFVVHEALVAAGKRVQAGEFVDRFLRQDRRDTSTPSHNLRAGVR